MLSPLRSLGAAALVASVAAGLLAPARASAADISVGVFPQFPTRAELGAVNIAANINLINGTTGGSITVTELTLVPSCGNFSPTCAGGADPGVFQLSTRGTGAAGTNCAGDSFDIAVVDAATGRLRITSSDGAPLLLAGMNMSSDLDTCRIDFTLSVRKLPVIDSYPNLAEPQTNQVGFMTVRHSDGTTGSDQGEDVTTIVGTVPPTTTTTTTTTTRPPTTTTTTRPPTTTTAPTTTTTRPPTTTTTTTRPPTTTTTTTRPPTTTTTTTVPAHVKHARFVDRAYRDLLARPPLAWEASFWADAMARGTTRVDVAVALTNSIEFRRLVVGNYYLDLLGRPVTAAEQDALVDAIAAGWLFEHVQTLVLGGDEFYARHGATPAGYVDALYRNVLGLTPDAAGRAFWIDQLTTKGLDRYSLALAFTTHTITHHRVAAAAGPWLLRRPATAAEVAGWAGMLDNGVRQEALFAALVASEEYFSKV